MTIVGAILSVLPLAMGLEGECIPEGLLPPLPPANVVVSVRSHGPVSRVQVVSWQDTSNNEEGFIVEAKRGGVRTNPGQEQWNVVADLPPNAQGYTSQIGNMSFDYRVMAYNSAGDSPYAYPGPPNQLATLTVQKSGSGSGAVVGEGIDCGQACSRSVAVNSQLTLTAVADEGSVFVGWSGADDDDGGTCSVVMNQDRQVTAMFDAVAPLVVTLTLQAAGDGSGTMTGDGINCSNECTEFYAFGTVLTITANADAGSTSTFAGWSGDTNSSHPQITLDMTRNLTVTATFSADARPEPPADLNLTATMVLSDTVRLDWSFVTGAEDYEIFWMNEATGRFETLGTAPEGRNWSELSPLEPGVYYRFKVSALVGQETITSEVVGIRALDNSAIADLSLQATPASDTIIVVHWDMVVPGCGYNLYVDGAENPENGNTPLTPEVPNITYIECQPGTHYTFRLEEVYDGEVTAEGEAAASTFNPNFTPEVVPELLGAAWTGSQWDTCNYAQTCIGHKIEFQNDGSFSRYQQVGTGPWELIQEGLVTGVSRSPDYPEWPLLRFHLITPGSANEPIGFLYDNDRHLISGWIGTTGGAVNLYH